MDPRQRKHPRERLGDRVIPPSPKNCLGEKVEVPGQKDDRTCHNCGHLGHKKRNYPHEQRPDNRAPPPAADLADPMAAHRMEDVFYTVCRKPRHTEAQC